MLILLSITLQAVTSPTVEVEALGPGRHRVVLTGVEADERISQAALAPIAAKLCGASTPRFGRFTLTRQVTSEDRPTTPARFTQDVSCGTAAPAEPSGPATALTPDAAADSSARAAATAFLSDYLAGRGPESWRRLTAGMQAEQPLPAWTAQVAGQVAAIGADPRFTIAKLTWYVDPPGVAKGVYAAADFTGSSRNAAALCGYVALHRGAAGGWSVARVESGTLARASAASADATTLAALRANLRCVDG